ncbi:hypothetical protein A3C86_02245 [Candidatus Kaiserbacteria bacterium RIFCSPHIGHO2_02_FULL_49_16]|uniref:GHMP kinase N-terminal domain-containing protein n=1 Tax=Candidatus Kaiserbacteria bacterium RIFCSPHIGHO2_02_FULL_49_16 TaxID=1798490 RepID=A0A1F6DCR8_9BACT|nr:MAG: hypothetical protein A3C86_02245 [Candidatus Kaiserbacteria bacterium RIFCSPHIGHO2_02_FULL_49_16]
MTRNSFAPGKIILSGEYAVIFGYAGIAVPSSIGIEAVFEEDSACENILLTWKDADEKRAILYAEKIVALCHNKNPELRGRLVIHANLPLGKGMGSSTALVIAITRALLGESAREEALFIENILSPGNSGFDFATIWENVTVLFRKGTGPKPIDLPKDILIDALLIDTGLPNESTTELVAWMRTRETEVRETLKNIDNCTDRIVRGEPLDLVMRDHNKAQVSLGVVPSDVQALISDIEQVGGSAKVIGAGSRVGGAGMVLALGDQKEILGIAGRRNLPIMGL